MSNKLNAFQRTIKSMFVAGSITLTSVLVATMASSASAATIFNLDSTIISGNISTPTYNFGTVTLTQNGNNVDVSVDLTQAWKILSFNLNYDGAADGSTISSSNSSISFASNNITLKGAGNGAAKGFDIELPDSGNLGFIQKFSTTLSSTAGNLTETNFLSQNAGGLFTGIHIGNNGLSTLPGGVTSIAIGSVTQAPPSLMQAPSSAPGAAVPEPLTILGAITAAGFGVVFKRHAAKVNKNDEFEYNPEL